MEKDMALTFNPSNPTALVVIDMQNGFCDQKGSVAQIGLDISMCEAAIPNCERLVEAAHKAGVQVIYTRFVYRGDYTDGGVVVQHLIPALAEVNSLAEGSWDADIIPSLVPEPQDIIIDKNRYSAFYGTRLETYLTSMGIHQLVLCGVTTNMCVETTARDASARDYHTFIAGDACGELERHRHDVALQTLGFGFGAVTTTDDIINEWSAKKSVGAAK
jgi:ureidoacrylate peracid hydrolase